MSDYKTIHGARVRDYTTDPTYPIEGQVWYDETNSALQYQSPNVFAAWRTNASLNTARREAALSGTQTSSMFAGGFAASPSVDAETWN